MKRGITLGLLFAGSACAIVSLPGCKSDGQKAAPASVPASAAPASVPASGATASVSVSAARVAIDTGERKVVFRVEVALTPEEHARGLMYRTRMAADAGMVFVFDEPRIQRFWMKNTLIPLDMIFIGADDRIVGIVENAAPETEDERLVGAPSQYVLEIGGGLSARLGIHAGQRVDFQGVLPP